MFSFLKNKPKVTFFTQIEGLKESAPIQPAISHIPSWFRKIPPSTDIFSSTIKQCPGFVDFMKRGYVVPLWCDLYINVKKTNEGIHYQWKTPDKDFLFEAHTNDQFLEHIPNDDKYLMVLKADCPWKVITDAGYSLYQLPMTYEYNEYFDVLPGIIHSDVYHTINQQICLKKEGEFVIKKGTPLAMYVPFKRESFDMIMKMEDDYLRNKRTIQHRTIKSRFNNRFAEYKKLIGFKENK